MSCRKEHSRSAVTRTATVRLRTRQDRRQPRLLAGEIPHLRLHDGRREGTRIPRAARSPRRRSRERRHGARLRAQLTGGEIAGGHAFDKHVVELGEFPGVTTRSRFARTIEGMVANGEMRTISGGRSAYRQDGVVVIRNPGAADGGTAFRPNDGYGPASTGETVPDLS